MQDRGGKKVIALALLLALLCGLLLSGCGRTDGNGVSNNRETEPAAGSGSVPEAVSTAGSGEEPTDCEIAHVSLSKIGTIDRGSYTPDQSCPAPPGGSAA